MNYRELGRTGWRVSAVSFGAWAIGGTWGTVSDDDSMSALRSALDSGVNFFDTADVYGDGEAKNSWRACDMNAVSRSTSRRKPDGD